MQEGTTVIIRGNRRASEPVIRHEVSTRIEEQYDRGYREDDRTRNSYESVVRASILPSFRPDSAINLGQDFLLSRC